MRKITSFLIASFIALALACSSFALCVNDRYKALGLSDGDLELIARAVRAEAAKENCLTKICVASMIMNRLCDGVLPRDAKSAVYEPGAFLFADRKSIDEDAGEDEMLEYETLVILVYEYGIDPTCGALFCFTEDDPEALCFDVTITVGGLSFARPWDVT